MFNDIGKLEHLVNKKSFGKKINANLEYKTKVEEKKPCKTCEKLNKGTRYHSESVCWFKGKNDDKEKKHHIKHVNNSVIEAELNDTNRKNE